MTMMLESNQKWRDYIDVLSPLAARAFVALALAVLAITGSTPAEAQTAERYGLKPGDVVSITVLEDPLLDRQVLVAPDGRVAIPLAGSVMAAGRTTDQLGRAIRGKLRSRFVEAPTVTVSLVSLGEVAVEEEEEAELWAVFVLGEVANSGRYEYDSEKPLTVLEALTLAGGPNEFSATERIQVRERVNEAPVIRLFNYEAILEGAVPTARDLTVLTDGAIIVVPERGLFE